MAMASSLGEVVTTGTATSGSGVVRTTPTTTMEITRGTTIQAVSEDHKGTATLRTATATTRTGIATSRTATATLGMATNSDAPATTTGMGGLSAAMALGINKALLLRRLTFCSSSMKRKQWDTFMS